MVVQDEASVDEEDLLWAAAWSKRSRSPDLQRASGANGDPGSLEVSRLTSRKLLDSDVSRTCARQRPRVGPLSPSTNTNVRLCLCVSS